MGLLRGLRKKMHKYQTPLPEGVLKDVLVKIENNFFLKKKIIYHVTGYEKNFLKIFSVNKLKFTKQLQS